VGWALQDDLAATEDVRPVGVQEGGADLLLDEWRQAITEAREADASAPV
jgi:hypothetical protein